MKIIITEKQKDNILENEVVERNVSKIIKFLNKRYEPIIATEKHNDEYKEKPMVKNLIDENILTLDELKSYILKKFNSHSKEFLNQVIKDWFSGYYNKYNKLSRNIKLF